MTLPLSHFELNCCFGCSHFGFCCCQVIIISEIHLLHFTDASDEMDIPEIHLPDPSSCDSSSTVTVTTQPERKPLLVTSQDENSSGYKTSSVAGESGVTVNSKDGDKEHVVIDVNPAVEESKQESWNVGRGSSSKELYKHEGCRQRGTHEGYMC